MLSAEGGGSSKQVFCIQDGLSLILKCVIVLRINYGNKKISQVAHKEITRFQNKKNFQDRARGALATSPEMLAGKQGGREGVVFQKQVLTPLCSATSLNHTRQRSQTRLCSSVSMVEILKTPEVWEGESL